MKGVVDTLNSLSEVSRIDLIFFCGSLNCDYSIRLLQSSLPTKCETKINSADLVPTTPAVETVQKYFFELFLVACDVSVNSVNNENCVSFYDECSVIICLIP